ncbi:unnamed protein product [Absidia cylindrospora]
MFVILKQDTSSAQEYFLFGGVTLSDFATWLIDCDIGWRLYGLLTLVFDSQVFYNEQGPPRFHYLLVDGFMMFDLLCWYFFYLNTIPSPFENLVGVEDGMELLSVVLDLSCAMKMNSQEPGLIFICNTIPSMTYLSLSLTIIQTWQGHELEKLVIVCSLFSAYIVVYISSLYSY